MNTHPSSHVLLQYAAQRLGINMQRLMNDFMSHYELKNMDNTEVKIKDTHIEIHTLNFIHSLTKHGKLTSIRYRGKRKAVARVTSPKPKSRPTKKHVAIKEPISAQPITHASAILDEIRNEARPRVFIKRKKTMEPH